MAHMETTKFEGTPEQLAGWLERLSNGKRYRITEIEGQEPEIAQAPPPHRVSAMGKYAFVHGGSEEFAREKQAEIEREDRPR